MTDKYQRLIEVLKLADVLGWVSPSISSYPLMQISEVEKCMIAMVDDNQLEQMREWVKNEPLRKLLEKKVK